MWKNSSKSDIETALQALHSLILDVSQEIQHTRTESEVKDKLERAREGPIEAFKLAHNWYLHLGTICLASIAAFAALLGGVFWNPHHWDGSVSITESYTLIAIHIHRYSVINTTFVCFILGAIGSFIGSRVIRNALQDIAKAETTEEIQRRVQKATSLKTREGWGRFVGPLFFGFGVLAFSYFIIQTVTA